MNAVSGTGALIRLVLRRDRLRATVWAVAILTIIGVSALSVIDLYPTQADAEDYVRLMQGNAAGIAFSGPGFGFANPNQGVVFANESTMVTALAFAFMSIFLVNRHTRAEEEAERAELLRSGRIGRHAMLTATLVVATAINAVLGFALGAMLIGLGLEPVGAIAFGLASAAAGITYASITAVAAQAATSGRGTLGLAFGVLGLTFTLRAVGDIGSGTLSWFSPIGWAQAVRPWAVERWWVLGLLVLASVGLIVTAFALESRRDLGGGLLPQRAGHLTASRWTTRPIGLAVRLQRGMLIGWAAGMFPLALIYGSFGRDVEQMLEDQPDLADFLAQIGGASIVDSYMATILLLMALVVAGFSIASALRLRTEELAGRAEPLLATPTSRLEWALSHLTVTVVGTILLLVLAGFGAGVGLAIAVGDSGEIARITVASLALALPVLVLAGAAVALHGLAPGAALGAWFVLVAAVLIGMFGDLLRLPDWVRSVSPFEHLPAMPAEAFALLPAIGLFAAAAALFVVGLVGFQRRDLR